ETVSEESRLLRGRLLVSRHVRRSPARRIEFDIEHEIFSFNRPENRLLKSAVGMICTTTRDLVNRALASEFESLLTAIPPSADVAHDLRHWDDGRNMRDYARIRP